MCNDDDFVGQWCWIEIAVKNCGGIMNGMYSRNQTEINVYLHRLDLDYTVYCHGDDITYIFAIHSSKHQCQRRIFLMCTSSAFAYICRLNWFVAANADCQIKTFLVSFGIIENNWRITYNHVLPTLLHSTRTNTEYIIYNNIIIACFCQLLYLWHCPVRIRGRAFFFYSAHSLCRCHMYHDVAIKIYLYVF